ncbi:MAG: YitT family protein [Duncaniella sp.]|nr:YitT family protein [Duncaniella sp.]
MKPTSYLSKKLWLSARDYIMIAFATIIYGFGFSAFILPEDVVIGGVTGLGTIVYFLTGNIRAIGYTQFVVNAVLLSVAWFIVGRQFVFKTLFGVGCITAVTYIMPEWFPEPLIPGEPFMNIIIGSALSGIALGLVFIHNGSTGGTDIVGAIVAKRSTTSIGRTMLYVDFFIIGSSYFLFHNLVTVVYGYIVLFIISSMVDMMINTNRQSVQFFIISRNWDRIANAVNAHARRGVTVIDGQGWYTKQPIKILLIVCKRIESVTIFRIVKSIDPKAFITQGQVSGVYGEGFDTIKTKQDQQFTATLESEYEDADHHHLGHS